MPGNGSSVSLGTPVVPVVSIVVATLNERENIPVLVERISQLVLPAYEVVVVDDGSTDGTRQWLRDVGGRDPSIRLVLHEGRQSLLQAHSQGIREARGEVVVIMDADLQHPPDLIPTIVSGVMSGTDIVIGSRFCNGELSAERSLSRTLISIGAVLLAKFVLGGAKKLSDPISGFYGFRRTIFVPINPRWRGFELLPFLLANGRHLSVTEVPYTFQPRNSGSSKIVSRDFSFVRTYLTQLILVAKTKRRVRGSKLSPADASRPMVADGNPEADPGSPHDSPSKAA